MTCKCLHDLVFSKIVFKSCLQISITPRELRLQRVRCFSYVSYLLVAANTSVTIAKVSFLMEKYIQFKMSLSPKHWEEGLSADGFLIKPGESQKFYLHFFPEDLATYEFYLPLKINDLIGPPLVDAPYTWRARSYLPQEDLIAAAARIQVVIPDQIPCVLVECTVAPAKLRLNKTDFKFMKSMKKGVIEDELIFKNPLKNPLVFSIGSMKSSSPFRLYFKDSGEAFNRDKGYIATLLPGESIVLTVKFEPIVYGVYEDTSIIVLKDINKNFTKQPYNFIRFHGTYKMPSLRCSSSLVFFPTIPLQMEGVRSLHIIAQDYEEEDEVLIENLNKGKEMQKLTFNFLEGNTIPASSRAQIPFNLVFSSLENVSFSTEVIIRDKKGRSSSSSFTVIASADNCSISTHSILVTKSLVLPRVKFIESEYVDSSNDVKQASVCSAAASGVVHYKLEGDGHQQKLTSTQTECFSLNNDVIAAGQAPSITASLLLKQVMPTRMVQFLGIQDYMDGSEHIKMVRKAIEKFFYEQVFHCSYYWEIGTNIKWSTAYNPAVQGAAARNSVLIKSLIEILERCYGKDIRTKFGQANIILPQEEVARVEKICSTLQIILNFLKSQGACLHHVEPKCLLDYNDYIIYTKTVTSNINVTPLSSSNKYELNIDSVTTIFELSSLNKSEFEHLKNQCWLDVMLQIYKTLVLNALPMTTKYAFPVDKDKDREKIMSSMKDKKVSSTARRKENMKMNISDVFKEKVNHNIYGRAEICVLAWLNLHYDRQRPIVWGPDRIPEPKLVNNFVECLSDCLVFAAVTAAYCPYITDIFFTNMYTDPQSREQKHHNAVCIAKAWEAIRIGFTIYPSDFVHPNCVLMLMLSVHLYKVLPSYLPETIVRFSTPLTTDTEHVIPLVNNSNLRNVYTIHIIGDPYQFFNIEHFHPLIVLKPKEKHLINVKFSARKAKTVTATLLFCGTCISPFFGVNKAYTLEGCASEFQTSIFFNLNATLNKLTKVALPIVSPFLLIEETLFDIWYAEKKPTTENFEAVPWTEVCLRKAPRRLYLSNSQIYLGGNEGTMFDIKIGCFTPKPRNFWLVFMNAHVGDFIVQIVIKPRIKELKEVIQVKLMENDTAECLCSELHVVNSESSNLLHGLNVSQPCPRFSWNKLLSPSCPWRTTVKISSRNNDLWHAIQTMFEFALEPGEKEFWSSHLETNIGLKLVQWMVGEEVDSVTEEINHIFQTSVNYIINCPSPFISFPPFLHIPDVRLYNTVEMLAHISPDAPDTFNTKLTLTAEHKKEIRIYKMIFTKTTVHSTDNLLQK